METIELKDGRIVSKEDYIEARTKDFNLSGFPCQREEVEEQLNLLLFGSGWTTVIGAFIEDDLAH